MASLFAKISGLAKEPPLHGERDAKSRNLRCRFAPHVRPAFLGASQPWIDVSGPPLTANISSALGLSLNPQAHGGVDEQTKVLVLTSAFFVTVAAILLIVTRIRVLGVFWRLGALVSLALPTLLAFIYWRFVADPVGMTQPANPSLSDKLASGIATAATSLGLVKISAGSGLYLVGAGCLLGFVACLVPALRQTTILAPSPYALTPQPGVPRGAPYPVGQAAPYAPPGWLPSPGEPGVLQYWNGSQWTGHRRRG